VESRNEGGGEVEIGHGRRCSPFTSRDCEFSFSGYLYVSGLRLKPKSREHKSREHKSREHKSREHKSLEPKSREPKSRERGLILGIYAIHVRHKEI
jgi:hypothetical protein